jgi:hypothetical protein
MPEIDWLDQVPERDAAPAAKLDKRFSTAIH